MPMPSSPGVVTPSQATRAERQLPLGVVVAVLIFSLVTLACTFLRPASRSDPGRLVHLTTLTRTPLPTLTPTPTIMSVAVAIPAPAADATSSSATLPVNELVEPNVPLATSSPGAAVQSVSTEFLRPEEAAGSGVVSMTGVVPTRADLVTPSATAPPSPLPTATASATPLPSPTPTVTATPLPTSTSTATPTPTPVPEDWTFVGMRLYTDQYDGGLLLYGNMINNTGAAQELLTVTGTFYDAQGQIIAGPDSSYAYWPGYVVPPGGSMPFELYINGIDGAADFDLKVEARPVGETPREDFEFADVNQKNEGGAYCVEGELRNPGSLAEYLVIAMVLYDSQDNLVNFGDYGEFGGVDGEIDFEICVDPPNQGVARYELQAWES